MCMEDIRIGRELEPNIKVVPCPDLTATIICSPDTTRTRLIVSHNGAFPMFIAPGELRPDSGEGYSLPVVLPRAVLRVEDWGRLLFEQWRASPVGGATVLTVTTTGTGKQ